MHRRSLLSLTGLGLVTTIAGCGGSSDEDGGDEDDGDGDETETNVESNDGSTDAESNDDDGADGDDEDRSIELLEHEWYYDGGFNAGVRGRLENVSGTELSLVIVSVDFVDEEGVQFAEATDNERDLSADSVWTFDVELPGDANPERVDSYDIEADATAN